MNNTLVLLDPSLKDHQHNNSINLGDLIIYDSVSKHLNEIFPGKEIVRISTHSYLKKAHFDLLKKSNLKFFGGTNALSSNVRQYHQWKLSEKKFFHIFPNIKNIVLFGVGWWQYQSEPDFFTRLFYKKILHRTLIHSVRDDYTNKRMLGMGFLNTLNTSCPTTWELNGMNVNRKDLSIKNCLFMLTDYKSNPLLDSKLITTILEYYTGEIFFFPQGSLDIDYINSIDIFKSNRSRIMILDRSMEEFKNCINRQDINYIGTRLHGGIKCLQQNIDSLIISVDNRATEIGKDINLPVVDLNNNFRLQQWIEGADVFQNISLPIKAIEEWKNQLRNIAL